MPGTDEGGKKAFKTTINKYGVDKEGRSKLHVRIGALGGATPTKKPKGFAANPELAREAGRKSKRKG